jgi:hypothetical protein
MNNYDRNILVLDEFYPDLAKRIRQPAGKPGALDVLAAKNGQPTVRRNGLLLHSLYDPAREAEAFIDSWGGKAKHNIFALGFAFGYHIDAFLQRGYGFNRIFVIEPDIELFRCALRTRNLVPLLKNERILFLVGLDPLELFDQLTYKALLVMSSKITVMEYSPSIAVNRRYFEDIRKKIVDAVRTAAANIDTLNYANRIFIRNVAENLVETVRSPGIKTLFGKFPGVPAVIVSAGPSLDKNIRYLKNAQGKCLILATDTSFKILLKSGIKPDLVFTEDFKKESRLHFNDIAIHDVPLVFDMQSAPASLQAYASERFVAASTRPFPFLINTLGEDKGSVSMGMSVAHFAFSAATVFGCDPIIFIGQDLSFTGGFTHARGTTSRERVKTAKNKNGKLVRVKSLLTGEDVLTNNQMYIYLRHFEKIIAKSDRTCINATEGGAGIKGAGAMKLRDAIRAYCTKDIPVAEIIRGARAGAPRPDVNMVIRKIEDLIRSMDEVKNAALQIMEILKRAFDLSHEQDPDIREIARHLARLKEPADKVMSAEAILMIIHADLLEHMMQQRREGRFDPSCLKGVAVKDMEADFKDDLDFQKAVCKGVTFVTACLAKSLQDLRKVA